jgi:hypothetical protein
MIALSPSSILARKRPVAIASMFVAELAWALVVATPVHAWARHAWGSHPAGDSVLWLPGGRDLLMWLGQEDAGASVTARTMIVLLALGAVLMQLPLGALLASLAFGRETADAPEADAPADAAPPAPVVRSLRQVSAWKVGVGAWLPLAGLLAFAVVLAIIVLSLGGIVASLVEHAVTDSLGDARAFTVKLVVLAVFGVLAAVLGVVVDLARAAVVREVGLATSSGTTAPGFNVMLRGVRTALGTARRSLRRATLGWASRAFVGVALVAIGYVAANVLGGRGGSALTGLFIVHQGVVVGRVALRASWLARALALVAPVQDEREAKRSGAP